MRNLLFVLIFLAPPFLKKLLLVWRCNAKFGSRSRISWFSSVMARNFTLGDYSTIRPFTLIRCDGDVSIGRYSEISSFSIIYGLAHFRIGDKCYIGPQVWINVSEDVILGNEVGIGPRTMIFTHGSFFPYTEGYPVRFGKVVVGNRVWVPAGVFIHPGVQVGDNVLVNSRSVLRTNIPSNVYVEGFPAKEICPIDKIRRTITPAKKDELIAEILRHFLVYLRQTKNKLDIINSEPPTISLRVYDRQYLIAFISSQRTNSSVLSAPQRSKIIFLLNNTGHNLVVDETNDLFFDFSTNKTPFSKDPLHRDLYSFMKMYYGIIFEYS